MDQELVSFFDGILQRAVNKQKILIQPIFKKNIELSTSETKMSKKFTNNRRKGILTEGVK